MNFSIHNYFIIINFPKMLHENDQKVEIFVFSRKFEKNEIFQNFVENFREFVMIGDARTPLLPLHSLLNSKIALRTS